MIRRITSALALALGLTLGLLWQLSSPDSMALADPGILHVAPGEDCGAATPCYGSVQAAVDAANPGDEIRVAAGTYTGINARGGITQTVYISKTVTVRGGYTTANWTTPDPLAHPTTLDAQGQGRVIVVLDATGVTLDGLHLTGGDATGLLGAAVAGSDAGGGLYAVNAPSLTLAHSQVYSNSARSVVGDYRTGYGGGLYLDRCEGARLEGNTVRANGANRAWSGVGGGAYLRGSNYITLKDNAILENVAAVNSNGQGGGLYLADCNDATVAGNEVADNVASNGPNAYGGGIYVYDCSRMLLDGNRVSGNLASRRSWGWGGGVYLWSSFALTMRDNIISSNTAAAYPLASGWGGGVYLNRGSILSVNTVLADNDALTTGSGLAAAGGLVQLLQTTVARNRGPGAAVHADVLWGNQYSTLTLTNTIIFSHTVGVAAEMGNSIALDATLWHDNTTDRAGAGTIHHRNDHYGDPALTPDGYHLTIRSAAIDRGMDAGVTTDIDGELRPWGGGYDLGADEFRGTRVCLPIILVNHH